MKVRAVTPKQVEIVSCPTCGVAPGKQCELSAGGLRTTAHRDRALSAAEALEKRRAAQARTAHI